MSAAPAGVTSTSGPDAAGGEPLSVYITVDTEVWPRFSNWRSSGLRDDIRRDIYGETPEGDFGIPFQTRLLNEHGLKAVFFVESLFACTVGLGPLREIVGLVQGAGHEVQLHLHTEWLAWMAPSVLPGRTGQNCRDFTLDEQTLLIRLAKENLQAAGATNVTAFRAGNYGANFDTLRALERNGIRLDTSYNAMYLDRECGLGMSERLLQPRWVEGVYEVPITFFEDRPRGRVRHAQVCAASAAEMEGALTGAWSDGWKSFVIVSHGFELIKDRKQTAEPPRPDRIVINRFRRLCRFLAEHKDRFRTRRFSDIQPEPAVQPARALRSSVRGTAFRYAEQLARRVL